MADEQNIVNDMAEIQSSENINTNVRGYIINVQRQVYSAVNAAMVETLWNIGKTIYDACGENDRAAYVKSGSIPEGNHDGTKRRSIYFEYNPADIYGII